MTLYTLLICALFTLGAAAFLYFIYVLWRIDATVKEWEEIKNSLQNEK